MIWVAFFAGAVIGVSLCIVLAACVAGGRADEIEENAEAHRRLIREGLIERPVQ